MYFGWTAHHFWTSVCPSIHSAAAVGAASIYVYGVSNIKNQPPKKEKRLDISVTMI